MTKQVAILAVNPVNGAGLFQYLEAFFENGISCKVFAVANTTTIRSNSGITLQADDIVAHLKGHANNYDALVFAWGMPFRFSRTTPEKHSTSICSPSSKSLQKNTKSWQAIAQQD